MSCSIDSRTRKPRETSAHLCNALRRPGARKQFAAVLFSRVRSGTWWRAWAAVFPDFGFRRSGSRRTARVVSASFSHWIAPRGSTQERACFHTCSRIHFARHAGSFHSSPWGMKGLAVTAHPPHSYSGEQVKRASPVKQQQQPPHPLRPLRGNAALSRGRFERGGPPSHALGLVPGLSAGSVSAQGSRKALEPSRGGMQEIYRYCLHPAAAPADFRGGGGVLWRRLALALCCRVDSNVLHY
jgi:hypothetical protein